MTTSNSTPARLFVLLARKAPIGVILRRGPSDWVQMIRWDTKNDVFTPGQWFHGRIYERKSDLSPDGKLLIYFAHKPLNGVKNPDYGNTWTAVSRQPYLTALGLWPHHGSDFYGGGGYFTDDKEVWVNQLYQDKPHPNHAPKGLDIHYPDDYSFDSELHFYFLRRDDWEVTGKKWNEVIWDPDADSIILWSKTRSGIQLIQTVYKYERPIWKPFKGYIGGWDYTLPRDYEYTAIDERSKRQIALDGVTWADFDQRRRFVLAKEGKLFSGHFVEGELQLTELADFNSNKPEAIPTPDWARRW